MRTLENCFACEWIGGRLASILAMPIGCSAILNQQGRAEWLPTAFRPYPRPDSALVLAGFPMSWSTARGYSKRGCNMSEHIIVYLFGVSLSVAAGIFLFFRQSAAVSVRDAGRIRAASPWALLAILLNLIATCVMAFLGRMELAILFSVVAALFSLPLAKERTSSRRARGG